MKRYHYLRMAFIFAALSLFFAALAFMARDAKRVWYVNIATSGPGNGTSKHPFKNLQTAIDVAQKGDRIEVAAGLYVGGYELWDGTDINFEPGVICRPAQPGPILTVLEGETKVAGGCFDMTPQTEE